MSSISAGTTSTTTLVHSGDTTGSLVFKTNDTGSGGTTAMTIDTSQNVGIGTSSPVSKLNINGGAVTLAETTLGLYNIDFQSRTASTNARIQYDQLTNSTGQLLFYTNGGTLSERMRIDSSGNLLVGTTGTMDLGFGAQQLTSRSTGGSSAAIFGNTGQSTTTQIVYNSNSSCDSNIIDVRCARSQNSAYTFAIYRSNSNADIEFYLRGDGNAYADGTWNNNGADYAEFFESANGQALTLGATVVLDGNKVREATDQDPASAIIGVVRPKEPSKASMVVGNTAWNKWANKYLTDDFDRYIMEDHDVVEWEEQVLEREAVAAIEAVVDEEGNEVSPAVPAQEATYKTVSHSYESHNIPAGITVPTDATVKTHDDKGNKFQHYKLNPAWDKDAEYVNRENRPEWNIIGLLGQVKILKGQPVGDRWIKMRDVSATVEEWMIR